MFESLALIDPLFVSVILNYALVRIYVYCQYGGLPVRLSVAGPEATVRAFQLQVVKWMEVLECHRVTGSDSFILKARVVSVEHLERFLDKLGHYGTTSTSTVLSSPVQQRVVTEKMVGDFEEGV